eukprot:scaffold11877_cov101-Isochrysis_galbana.AAC.2
MSGRGRAVVGRHPGRSRNACGVHPSALPASPPQPPKPGRSRDSTGRAIGAATVRAGPETSCGTPRPTTPTWSPDAVRVRGAEAARARRPCRQGHRWRRDGLPCPSPRGQDVPQPLQWNNWLRRLTTTAAAA